MTTNRRSICALSLIAFVASLIAPTGLIAPIGGRSVVNAGTARPTAAVPVTVRGELERVVLEGPRGAVEVLTLRAVGRTWRLEGLDETFAESGSVIEVTGAPNAPSVLHVQHATVLERAAPAATAPASTRVLIIRVFWKDAPPATPTTKVTRARVLRDSQRWFEEVSHGRYGISGTVTPWLRVPRPAGCADDLFQIRDDAIAAARRGGHRTSRYGRILMYLPCRDPSYLGAASESRTQDFVWLFGTLGRSTIMHEQGHNLGLNHAASRSCSARGWAVTWSSRCDLTQYGDVIDVMGNRASGHFNAFHKAQLGWLQRAATVRSSRTVTLKPVATTGSGYKAARIAAGEDASYWLEYRTRTGVDAADLPGGTAGVQIRYFAPVEYFTQLLDAAPGSTTGGGSEWDDVHLPVGSSWTTPQGVRITILAQRPSGARVAIRFGAGAPRVPVMPDVRATPVLRGVRLRWPQPDDRGSIIRHYVITRRDTGESRTVISTGGAGRDYTWDALDPARRYSFAVRAVSVIGRSASAISPAARPLTDLPSADITTPNAGSTVSGVTPVEFVYTPANGTGQPIAGAFLLVDFEVVAEDFVAPFGHFDWNTFALDDGEHHVRVIVRDMDANVGYQDVFVTVDNSP